VSFILDALRKSEHDRQREKGPGLAEVAVSPPKPKKNVWATVAVGLLVINLLAVGVLLLRRAGQHSNATVTNTTATGGAATGAGSCFARSKRRRMRRRAGLDLTRKHAAHA